MLRRVHGGLQRRAYVAGFTPDWVLHAPMPLVIVLHDERSNLDEMILPPTELDRLVELSHPLGAEFEALLKSDDPSHGLATPASFALLMPEGSSLGRALNLDDRAIGDRASWNSGHRGEDGLTLGADDVGYIESLIRELVEKANAYLAARPPPGIVPAPTVAIDLDRIYVVGIGNGGMMAYRLACELPTRSNNEFRVRAMVVSGATGGGWRYTKDKTGSTAANPVPHVTNNPRDRNRNPIAPKVFDLLMIHGREDMNVALEVDPGEDGTTSIAERDRILDEAPNATLQQATDYAPWDHTPERTLEVYRRYYIERTGAETQPVPPNTRIERSDRDGNPTELELTAGSYVGQWGGAPTTITIAKLIDPGGGSGLLPWTTALLCWQFLTDPTTILS